MAMVWATVAEVRQYWQDAQAAAPGERWPALPGTDSAVTMGIRRAATALALRVLWWPELDEDERAADAEVRALLVEAVALTMRARLLAPARLAELGGDAAAAVLAAGGRIKADSLEVETRGAGVRPDEAGPPRDALTALQAAGLTGGAVASW